MVKVEDITVCKVMLVPLASTSEKYIILGCRDTDINTLQARIDCTEIYWGSVIIENGKYEILDKGIKLNTDKITLLALFKQSCINLNPVTEYRLDDYSRALVEIIESRGEVPKELQLNI